MKVATVLSLPTQQQANTTKQLQRPRRRCFSWISAAVQLFILMSADEVMTDCCDQLLLGFKTPRLWVAQQCRSLTPPPTSRRGRHIYASFLENRRGGNKCTLRGGKSADQNRRTVCRPLSKTADQAAKRTGKLAAWCSV